MLELTEGLGGNIEGMGEVGSPAETEGRPGLDSTGGLGTYVGVPGFGPPGVEQDWTGMVSVTVV